MARQYRIALYDAEGRVIEGAQYMHVSEETPTPGLRIDLPQGTWFAHEVAATWSDDPSSRLLGSDPHYGGTLICHPRLRSRRGHSSRDIPEHSRSRGQPAALAAWNLAADNSSMRRKSVLIVVGILSGVLLLAILGFGMVAYGQASEAAMTSCGGVPSDVRKGASTTTIQSGFPPWKFTCVFYDLSGRVVAKVPAPYEVPWHNLWP